MIYTGIGSRSTPDDILQIMESFALGVAKYATLRSGGAEGADTAFEDGAIKGFGKTEIYLPWSGFNNHRNRDVMLHQPSSEAMEVAAAFHSGWSFLSHGAKKLHARNVHQVLGADLNTQADMVICWTPDGSLDGKSRTSGGTGQALRIAAAYEIPVWNLKRVDHLFKVMQTFA